MNANKEWTIHPKDYNVQFTGNYKTLKSLGYTFQKLYAKNYMQWNKADVRIWKKGGDVTHDTFSHKFPAILNLLLNVGINNLPWEPCRHFGNLHFKIYINKITFECTMEASQYKRDRDLFWESTDLYESKWESLYISQGLIEPIIELVNMNAICIRKMGKVSK